LIALGIIAAVVLIAQSDTGSFGVMIVMMGTMAFVAGLPLGRIIAIGGIVLFGLILVISVTPYRRARLETYLHPQSN
jgi:cell division protein FtsW (lipid II flippase)